MGNIESNVRMLLFGFLIMASGKTLVHGRPQQPIITITIVTIIRGKANGGFVCGKNDLM